MDELETDADAIEGPFRIMIREEDGTYDSAHVPNRDFDDLSEAFAYAQAAANGSRKPIVVYCTTPAADGAVIHMGERLPASA